MATKIGIDKSNLTSQYNVCDMAFTHIETIRSKTTRALAFLSSREEMSGSYAESIKVLVEHLNDAMLADMQETTEDIEAHLRLIDALYQ